MREDSDLDLFDDLEERNNEDENIYPIKEVKIEKKSFSIFDLNRKIEKENIIINPNFQREKRWGNKQKSELLESILMGVPIPIIYAYQTQDGKMQVVDGRQRLSTLNEFLSNKFKLGSLKILNDLNKKFFNDLSEQEKTKIEEYQIDVYVITPPTPEKIKYDIFDRVNRGGTRLNNQEIRNALYNGVATEIINKMCEFQSFKNATGNPNSKAMKDRYLALRFLAFYLIKTKKIQMEFVTPMDEFLAKIMREINKNFKKEDFKDFLKIFNEMMSKIYENYEDNLFRFNPKKETDKKRRLSIALFESLSYVFMYAIEQNKKIPSKERIEEFKNELDKPERITYGIDSKENIDFRFNKAMELL